MFRWAALKKPRRNYGSLKFLTSFPSVCLIWLLRITITRNAIYPYTFRIALSSDITHIILQFSYSTYYQYRHTPFFKLPNKLCSTFYNSDSYRYFSSIQVSGLCSVLCALPSPFGRDICMYVCIFFGCLGYSDFFYFSVSLRFKNQNT